MEFRLLGPVEIVSDTGEMLVLAREKEKRLLAVLLMNAGHVLSKEKLISYLADDPGGIADGTLRAYLHRVKRVIDAAGGSAELVTREGGYQLRVPDDTVDVRRFRRLRHQADIAARSGNTDHAVALLCQAEALWYGSALAGLEGEWAAAAGHGLDEERRSCTLRRIELELNLGRHSELLGELRRLRAQYPTDEIRAAHEMKALYWSGRQEDALDVYRQIRDCLVEQGGLEPGPELAELHQKILHRDLAPADFLRKPPVLATSPEVPLRETAFVGRETDIGKLTSVGPGTPRVWVISGLSGVGKTRLALEAARRLAGETLFLEFHAKDDDQAPLDIDGALRRLLEQAGVDRSVLRYERARLVELWQRELAGRQMTIILDDVPDAGAIEALLPKTGSCRVFITARQRLHGIPSASGHTLDALPERDAIALFSAIAGETTISPDDIAAAVRRCHGLPIAINIEAGRLRQDGRLPTTSGTAQPAETGEMSDQLQMVLDSCYQALAEDEQVLFRFLGVNPCPAFTTESAAAIAGIPERRVGEITTVLFDRHLIDQTASGGFRLHDLLRDYVVMVASRDLSIRDRRDAERRLLDYYLREADRADRELYPHRRRKPSAMMPPSQRPHPDLVDRARRWMEAEWRNALAAAEHAGRHERKRYCAELVHLLANFLDIRGYWDEAAAAQTQALRACRDLEDPARTAQALVDLSRSSLHKGQHQAALTHAQNALNVYRLLGDLRGEAEAVDRIGVAYYQSGEFREALAYEQEARDLYAQVSDLVGENEALFRCGVVCMELGRLSESLRCFNESMEISERSGDIYSLAMTLNSLGEVNRRQGYHRDAIIYYRKSLLICRRMGAVRESATVMQNIGHVHLYKGNCERALAEFRCALSIFRQINDLPGQARAMCDFGDAYLALEDYEQGLVYYKDAVSAAERVGNLHVQLIAMRGIADSLRGTDRHEESIECYRDALIIAQRLAIPYQQAKVLKGLAEAMIRSGQVGAGRIYLRQAYDLYQASGAIEAESARLRLQNLG